MANTKKVKTLTEYVSAVEGVCLQWDRLRTTAHPLFRGQTSAGWKLIPGLYRGSINKDYERELVRDFQLRSVTYLERTPQNYLEWLFLMQHYGMPTRLLDWTESHLFALYFAVAERNSTANGVVWILDPWSLNHHSVGMESVPTSDHPILASYILKSGQDMLGREIQAKLPVAVRPPKASPRINAQRGAFTVHGAMVRSLDAIAQSINNKNPEAPVLLSKVIIDGSRKKQLRRELYLAGVTEAVMFPDLVGLSNEISYRYSKEYMEEDKPAKKRPSKGTRRMPVSIPINWAHGSGVSQSTPASARKPQHRSNKKKP